MAKKHVQLLFFLAMVLLMLVNPANCGPNILANTSFVVVSDGVREFQQPDFIVLDHYWPPSSDGFRPCIITVSASIFLMLLVYISLMLFAAKLLYDGSELLVEIASPRITGGVFLPLLGSVLDAVISFATNLCGNNGTAQNDKVSAGINGMLTGSTAVILILLGGSCLLDVSALWTDLRASNSARIMVISVMPFIAIQLSHVLSGTSPICLAVLASLIASVSLLLAYCLYQVFHPSILKRRLAYAKPEQTFPLGRLLIANREPNVEDIRKLFEVMGKNSDELRAFLKGIQIKDKDPAINDVVGDCKISMEVFIKAVMMLALGSLITAIFAGPLIDAVDNFSTAANIPPFLFPFAALPFAVSSEAVSAAMFASHKKLRISLTFSKIYGAVSVSKILCLSVFSGLLYFRHLTWNFTSELLIILIVWSFLPRNMG